MAGYKNNGKSVRAGLQVVAIAAVAALAPMARAAALLSSDIVVERIGGDASFNGAGASSSSATAVFIDEFGKSSLQTLPVQTIAMPAAVGGANQILTDSGSATSNGYLSRSADGSVLVLSGYNTAVGTASVAGSNPATINRVVGVVDALANVDTSRTFSNGPTNNFRSVASDDGSRFWLSTAGSATAPGVMLYPGSPTPGTATTILNGNTRTFTIFGGRLFASSSSAAPGIGIIDLGALPTASTTSTVIADSTSGTGSPSPYGFQFFDLDANDYQGTGADTLYVADDRSTASGGGLQRWHYDGSAWSLSYTMTTNLPTGAAGGLRGLTGELVAGNPVLYVSNAGSSTTNSLWSVTDTGAASSFNKLADSPANTFFRGVALAPVTAPEPTGIAFLAFGGLAVARRRRSH